MMIARDINEANPSETIGKHWPVVYCQVEAQPSWPRFERADVIDDGKTLAILIREFDGTISAVRIPIDRVAD